MGNEITGYYSQKKETLLEDFNQMISLMENTGQQDQGISESVRNRLIVEYEKLIPEIPYVQGYRQRMFNGMLLITAQALAMYRVFGDDKKPAEVWEVYHSALLLRLQQIPSRRKWLVHKTWNTLFRAIMMRRAQRNVKETLGNFELEYIKGNGDCYDYGINYTRCGHHKFLKEYEAEELLPYVCLADIALSDVFGWGLTRTQTIGDGCTYCDFRFKKGSPTKITSNILEVQELIDRLTS